jgi:hypothetical protein
MRSALDTLRKVTLLVSMGLFCLSLFFEGFYWAPSSPLSAFPGWQLLFFGWSAIPHGGVAWLANPVISLAWVFLALRRLDRSAGLAALGLALMVSFLFVSSVASMYGETTESVVAYGFGYWLWVASAVVLLIGSLVAALPTKFLD